MPNVTITIQQIEPKQVTTKFGTKNKFVLHGSDGQKYDTFNKPANVIAGQTYDVEFEMNGNYRNFKSASPTTLTPASVVLQPTQGNQTTATAGPVAALPRDPHAFENGNQPFPLPLLHGNRTFVRKDALTLAVQITNGIGIDADGASVVNLARVFEAYISGDSDGAEAKAIIESERKQVNTSAQQALGNAIKAAIGGK